MDLLRIVIVTISTFIPSIYYVFICEPVLQKLHWAIVSQSERPPLFLFIFPAVRSVSCDIADMYSRSHLRVQLRLH